MTTPRQRKIVKLGASCGLTLPADLCISHGFALGSIVDVVETKDGLLLRQPRKQPMMSLKERIALTSVECVRSLGQAFRDEPAVGREVE